LSIFQLAVGKRSGVQIPHLLGYGQYSTKKKASVFNPTKRKEKKRKEKI